MHLRCLQDWQQLSRAGQSLLDSLHCRSYPALLYRCWKLYVLGSSVWGAARVGVAGFRAGYGMGKTLVEEQTSILVRLLGTLGEVLGTPYAELLWCQAVACVAFALISEMVYTSLLGALLGGVIGFLKGYMAALHASVSVAAQGASRSLSAGRQLAKAAGLALRFPWAALRAATGVALRTLPLRVL
ncbi:hypothetical protein GPECTOR_5g190 [Gonium pectorale]|uniref:Uncharacterized protein n=1 Tax=Gonium pectorale TaxID=33097 RepID=A0A150GWB8_GONPE|nr:hypothetical protein GPECTOR_5g190 [Gonium pectorale]|eukprot:KXZ54085.1 hypothetical protein GPECTOR_5g190 [Gonium pectorale]